MRAVIQRVRRCRVTVESRTTGEIGPGLLVLLGVGKSDTEAEKRASCTNTLLKKFVPQACAAKLENFRP